MFQISKHRIDEDHALNNRKLKENYFHFAGHISEVSSDSISRDQFFRRDFRLNTFIEFEEAGWKYTSGAGLVNGDSGDVVLCIDSLKSFDRSGDYCITWSAEFKVRSGDCRFLSCHPFLGSQLIGSAEDCYYEMGYINNIDPTESAKRSQQKHNPRGLSFTPYEKVSDVWDIYGEKGRFHSVELSHTTREDVASQSTSDKHLHGGIVHLSGTGYVNMPRASGNIGLIVYAQEGSKFGITSARISVRKRNR